MASTVEDVTVACAQLADVLDQLAPDMMSAEDCVRVISLLTKGPQAVTTVAKSTKDLLDLRLLDLAPPTVKGRAAAQSIAGHTVRASEGSPKYSDWQTEDLIRAVLDSRLIDLETMEVVDESPADKLMHVFSLSGSNARLTALKERGLRVGAFCTVTRAPKVEVI